MAELAIVVPTYNEAANVARLVDRLESTLAGCSWEVVFVDDDSPDGTSGILRDMAQRMPQVRCLQRIGRRGLSRAVIEGILSTSAPVVAVMDADLQHDESILPTMWRKLVDEDLDVVVGSRYTEGGSVGEWANSRHRMSRFATRLAHQIVDASLSDPMSGFFILRRGTFESVAHRLSGHGYKILFDILASHEVPPRVGEVPYTFRTREAGESKLGYGVLLEFAIMLADKYVSRFVPFRFLLFSLIGASGVVVHFSILWLLHRGMAIDFGSAQAAATLVAMTSNYTLNNWLTYRDRQHKGMRWFVGLLSFYAVCGLGVIANVGVATALFANQGWILAAAAGAVVGTVWNYAASAVVTWRRR